MSCKSTFQLVESTAQRTIRVESRRVVTTLDESSQFGCIGQPSFLSPDDFLYVWKGDVLGGSVLVEEHYIIGFQIIGSLAPIIAECFPARAD